MPRSTAARTTSGSRTLAVPNEMSDIFQPVLPSARYERTADPDHSGLGAAASVGADGTRKNWVRYLRRESKPSRPEKRPAGLAGAAAGAAGFVSSFFVQAAAPVMTNAATVPIKILLSIGVSLPPCCAFSATEGSNLLASLGGEPNPRLRRDVRNVARWAY